MVVFTSSLPRMKNFEITKKSIKDLKLFPAVNTIDSFDHYVDFSNKNELNTQAYISDEQTILYKGKLGCNLSHQLLYEEFLKSDASWLLVLEDDVIIENYSDEIVNDILEIAENNNSHFIQLYTNPGFIEKQLAKKSIYENLYEMIPQWHTLAYFVDRTGIKMLKEEYPINENIDIFLSNNIQNLNSLCWVNNIFKNGGDVPDTKPIIVNGKEIWKRTNSADNNEGSLIWNRIKTEEGHFSPTTQTATTECKFCPDFLIAGVQKGGTTSSIPYMSQHPNIHMANEELHFFWDTNKYKRGLCFYEDSFKIKNGCTDCLVGEKSPDYSVLGYALDRIYENCPNTKLILFLRNPIDRAYSAWNMHKSDKNRSESRTFREATEEDVQWADPLKWAKNNGTMYVRRGYYIDQIEYICNKFGRENLHIAISEKCREKTSLLEQYNGIFNFLGVSEMTKDEFRTGQDRHISKYETPISEEDREYLRKIYEPYNKRLFDFLGYEIKEWGYDKPKKWAGFEIYDKTLLEDFGSLITIDRMDIVVNMIYCKFYDKKIKSNFAYDLYIEQKKSEKGEELIEHPVGMGDKLVSNKKGEDDWIKKFNDLIECVHGGKFSWKDNQRAIDMITISKKTNQLVRGAHRVALHHYFNKKIYVAYNEEPPHSHKCSKIQNYEYVFNEFINLKKDTLVYCLFPEFNTKKNDDFITKKINDDGGMDLLYKKSIKLNENGFIYFLIILYQIHKINGVGMVDYGVIRTKLKKSFNSGGKVTLYFVEKKCNRSHLVNFKKNIIRKHIDSCDKPYSFHVCDNHEETKNISQFVLNDNNIKFANSNNIAKFNKNYPSLNDIKNTNINKKIDVNKIIKNVFINSDDYCVVGSSLLSLFGIRESKDVDIISKDLKNDNFDIHNKYIQYFMGIEPDDIIYNPNNHFYFFGVKFMTPEILLTFKEKRYLKTKDEKDKVDITQLKEYLWEKK